ncbi:MAG: YhbY family RNA-binding protein [Candidatus Bathyarchaeota archaeon]|nr:YhbY family RNA-binding protein [Candidatus Bathyarchaeota archaeon]|tara:strand:+ start:248 stop:553 length:306 start_codon:yes stop_codon:yes gene_type:complete
MDPLTPRQIRSLKKQAHSLKPRVQIGRNDITEATISNIDKVLKDHELIKIKYLEHKAQRKIITAKIAAETRSNIIHEIGNTAILYRRSADYSKRGIEPGKP